MRLIDADTFKEHMDYVCDSGGWLEPVTKAVTEYVKKQIDAEKTVDAVPVVRCKDCIHRRKGGFSRSETDGWTVVFTAPCDMGDEGFCSNGEKVTE